ncbi:MAG TPA: porin [Polyangia bacterium]|nr:porin [Polyangia bacterium]
MTVRSAAMVLGVSLGLSAMLAPGARAEIAAVKTPDAELDFGGMVQLLGFAQHLDDPDKNDDRAYLFMNRARLRVSGRYDEVTFHLEMALGGEAAIVAQTAVSLSLLDFAFEIPLSLSGNRTTYLKVGQFKVPYGREQLTYEGNFQFADRSINNLGFVVGRDVGAAVVSHPGMFTLIGGLFTGGGRDVPGNHYLPEKLGIPLFVARAGVGNLDGDPFYLEQDIHHLDAPIDRSPKGAVFVNALYTKDTLIGHSTVLNVKLADKSLLLDADWNPYIAEAPFSQGTWWQAGGDAAGRLSLRQFDLSGEAAFDFGKYSNGYGSVQMWGLRAQGGIGFRSFEVAVRYAYLVPDANFSYMTVPLTGSEPIQEITTSATWFIRGQRLKLLADLPIIIHDPVFTEAGVGSYAASDLPDQATVLATAGVPTGNTVARQNVVEARLMLQAQF